MFTTWKEGISSLTTRMNMIPRIYILRSSNVLLPKFDADRIRWEFVHLMANAVNKS